MGKMRVTTHRGRVCKDGADKGKVYSTRHNDREFNVVNASHIDGEKSKDNIYMMYNIIDKNNIPDTFESHEQQFYDAHFSNWLDAQTERYRKKRNYKRIKTMDEIRKCARYAPEEVIMQIGDKDNTVPRDVAIAIHADYIKWHTATYPQCVLLDSALHADEATTHYQDRYVWIAHDEQGNEIIGQEKALAEMGYSLPEPDKKESRYNNRKIEYTADTRKKFIEICQSYGLEIEIEPREPSKSGLSLLAYKCKQMKSQSERDADEIRQRAERDAERIRQQAMQERMKYEELCRNQQQYIMEIARKIAVETNRAFAMQSQSEQAEIINKSRLRLEKMGEISTYNDDYNV